MSKWIQRLEIFTFLGANHQGNPSTWGQPWACRGVALLGTPFGAPLVGIPRNYQLYGTMACSPLLSERIFPRYGSVVLSSYVVQLFQNSEDTAWHSNAHPFGLWPTIAGRQPKLVVADTAAITTLLTKKRKTSFLQRHNEEEIRFATKYRRNTVVGQLFEPRG